MALRSVNYQQVSINHDVTIDSLTARTEAMPLKLMTLACPVNQNQVVIGIKDPVEANELKLKNQQETEWYQKIKIKKK